MKLPGYVVHTLLALMFVVAAAIRFSATTDQTSPYFEGASAMTYRHATAVADGVELGQPDRRANFPEGYVPARYRASGVEYGTGTLFKAVRYFSESDGRDFVRRWVVFTAAAMVFTLYALASALWQCQMAGLIAAFFVVFFQPFVDTSNGRSFDHALFAVFLTTIHAILLLRHRRGSSTLAAGGAALAGLAMLAAWELAPYYVAAVCVLGALYPGYARRDRLMIVGAHAGVLLAASVWLPYLAAVRMIGGWPVACALSALLVTALPGRAGGVWRRALFIAAGTAALTVLLTPVRAGADQHVSVFSYVARRLRWITGKPEVASNLPDAIRHLWSSAHAVPSTHQLLSFLTPVAFFAAALGLSIRRHPSRRALGPAATVAALGVVAYGFDRSAVGFATVATAIAVSASGHHLSDALRSRGSLLAVGGFLVVVQLLFPMGAANPVYRMATLTGVAHQDPATFLWVSTENTERELVKFVSKRTAVRDPFLGTANATALLLTFSGRTTVQLEGAISNKSASRHVSLDRLFYSSIDTLKSECQRLGVRYVLYSVDFLLDTSPYSPRYLAADTSDLRHTAAWQLHFYPERLHGLTLVYENDHYRLFKVTDESEPVFITDHPPVYHLEVLDGVGGDLAEFGRLNARLMLAWSEASVARNRGDYGAALGMLSWSLQQAPRYTRARIAVATTLMQMNRVEEARDVIMSVVNYAPDNAYALYQAAYIQAQLGEIQTARGLLAVFRSTASDADLIERANLLEAFLDQGVPVAPNALQGAAPADSQ